MKNHGVDQFQFRSHLSHGVHFLRRVLRVLTIETSAVPMVKHAFGFPMDAPLVVMLVMAPLVGLFPSSNAQRAKVKIPAMSCRRGITSNLAHKLQFVVPLLQHLVHPELR